MQILKTILPIRLICMILYVQAIALFFAFGLYDFREFAIWLAWLPLLMLPYLLLRKKWVFIFVASLIFCENLLNLCHLIIVKGTITVSSLFVIANTNIVESSDFLGLKIGFHFLLLLPYIALFVFSLMKIPQVVFSRKSIVFLIIAFVYSGIYLADNTIHASFVRNALPASTRAVMLFHEEMKTYKSMKNRTISKIDADFDAVENCRQICVLVIGESANRNHLGLYGYGRNTTPKFSARKEIVVYSDAITPYSHTINAVLSLYTEASIENKKPYDLSLSLLDIFYSAGFKTFWLSNQPPVGIYDNAVSNVAQTADRVKFLNISSNSSHESIFKKSYDGLLLAELSKTLKDTSQNLFITIHLMGSHAAYRKRYPPEFEYFKNDKNTKQKTISQYDNSIRYTDYILDSILNMLKVFSSNPNIITSFIYCSDHGDNVYDYNNTAGHDWAGYIPNCIVEIPLIIWLSDSYKNKYPEKTNNILKNKDLPFSSDNLFHVVLDLQNIHSPYFNASKSVVNEHYNIPSQRILEDGGTYISGN